MILKSDCYWDIETQKKTPQKHLILKIDDKDYENVKKALTNLNQRQKDGIKRLKVQLDYYTEKRTLDQNALMWALYNILQNEIGTSAEELYNDDLTKYAKRFPIMGNRETFLMLGRKFKHIIDVKECDGIYTGYGLKSTSLMNTKEMAQWIEMLFLRIAEMGIELSNAAEIARYWQEWRTYLNKEKIVLNEEKSIDEYRQTCICEACGSYMENGQIAHIKSRGAGGSDIANNLLYLCHNCHNIIQHQKGWGEFLKNFPHLEYKINTALSALRAENDVLDDAIENLNSVLGDENEL